MNKLPERCSEISLLNEFVQVMLNLALADISKQAIDPLVVETYRPQERQNYLYCQGHTITQSVAAGIGQAFAEAYCPAKIVSHPTATVNSVHTSRNAVDIVPQRIVNGKMAAIWDCNDKQSKIIIKTMQKYGFEAGANWTSFPDSPHFQAKGLSGKVIDSKHTTLYLTASIQKALGLTVDSKWGKYTSDAVNNFLIVHGYKQLIPSALKDLLIKLA